LLVRNLQGILLHRNGGPLFGDDPLLVSDCPLMFGQARLLRGDLRLQTPEPF
jgi:hypothetical protein